MAFNFEKLLNDSMLRIYDKYKDRDDSLDNVIDINISEEDLKINSETSSIELYGEEDENFTFMKIQIKEMITKKNLISAIDFNRFYDFIFKVDAIDEIVDVIDILDGL